MTASPTPQHHPACHLLVRFASGNLSEPMRLLVASHLALCPACRFELQSYEAQAGLGLEDLPPEAMDRSCLETLLAKIDEHGPPVCIDVTLPPAQQPDARYPEPLRALIGLQGELIEWMQGAGLAQGHVKNSPLALSFMQIEATHPLSFPQPHPARYALILDGVLSIGGQTYQKGDIVALSALQAKPAKAQAKAQARAQTRTLFLVATPEASDRLSWLGAFTHMLECLWRR